jgi:hypothetical protein
MNTDKSVVPQYRVEVTLELNSLNPVEAVYDFIEKFINEEIVARVIHIPTGAQSYIGCSSGEPIDFIDA